MYTIILIYFILYLVIIKEKTVVSVYWVQKSYCLIWYHKMKWFVPDCVNRLLVSRWTIEHLMMEELSNQRSVLLQGQGSSLHRDSSNQLNTVDFENCLVLVTVWGQMALGANWVVRLQHRPDRPTQSSEMGQSGDWTGKRHKQQANSHDKKWCWGWKTSAIWKESSLHYWN